MSLFRPRSLLATFFRSCPSLLSGPCLQCSFSSFPLMARGAASFPGTRSVGTLGFRSCPHSKRPYFLCILPFMCSSSHHHRVVSFSLFSLISRYLPSTVSPPPPPPFLHHSISRTHVLTSFLPSFLPPSLPPLVTPSTPPSSLSHSFSSLRPTAPFLSSGGYVPTPAGCPPPCRRS